PLSLHDALPISSLAGRSGLVGIRVNDFQDYVVFRRVHAVVNLAVGRHYHSDFKRAIEIVNLAVEKALILLARGLIGTGSLAYQQYLHPKVFMRIVAEFERGFVVAEHHRTKKHVRVRSYLLP